MLNSGESPEALNALFRSGNDDEIKSKNKPRKRAGDGPIEKTVFHAEGKLIRFSNKGITLGR